MTVFVSLQLQCVICTPGGVTITHKKRAGNHFQLHQFSYSVPEQWNDEKKRIWCSLKTQAIKGTSTSWNLEAAGFSVGVESRHRETQKRGGTDAHRAKCSLPAASDSASISHSSRSLHILCCSSVGLFFHYTFNMKHGCGVKWSQTVISLNNTKVMYRFNMIKKEFLFNCSRHCMTQNPRKHQMALEGTTKEIICW